MGESSWENQKPPGLVKDKLSKTGTRIIEVPEGLWVKCPSCQAVLDKANYERNDKVCHECDHHFRLSSEERIQFFCDHNSFEELDANLSSGDPLEFEDTKVYKDRLKAMKKKTALSDAFLSGFATLNGQKIAVGAFEFSYLGGSMGIVVGERITRLMEYAVLNKCPVVIFSSSGGARMQEGILSLMQMAKTTTGCIRLKRAGLPFVSVMCDPTTGGVAASFASLGDICIAEPKALIGFAGPRVIEQTIRQKLPEGFQRSEFLLEHGMLDQVVHRKNLKERISSILSYLSSQ